MLFSFVFVYIICTDFDNSANIDTIVTESSSIESPLALAMGMKMLVLLSYYTN